MHRDLRHPLIPCAKRAWAIRSLAIAGLLLAGFEGAVGSALAQSPPTAKVAPRAAAQGLAPLDPATASSDVHFVLDIRPTMLLKNAEIQKLVEQIPHDAAKPSPEGFLLSGQIEQILVFGFERKQDDDAPNGNLPPQMVIVLRSTKPIDWKVFMSPRAVAAKSDGISFFRSGDFPGSTCFRVIDDRTYMMGNESDVLLPPIGRERARGRHGWDQAWKGLATAPIRIAFDTPWLARSIQPPRAAFRPDYAILMGLFSPLFEKSQAYAMAIDVADGLTLDAVATCGSEEDSRRVTETIRACLTLGRNALPEIRRAAEGGPPQMARTATELLDALDTMLETIKIEQDKSVAKLHAKTDADTVTTAVKTLIPAVGASREAARRAQCVNNLKQIELALFNYESSNGSFPPTVLYGPDGKTPYSWRVAILPFLEHADLYNQYKFDEPWDGPNNRKLIDKMPTVFACPDDEEARAMHYSSYFAPKSPDTLLSDRKEGTRIADITDGTSNTIMIVEAKRPIPWSKPEDIAFADGMPKDALGGLHPGGYNVGMGDGSVRFLEDTINLRVLQSLFTRSGGEVISSDSY